MERAEELLQNERDLKRQQALQDSKHPWLRKIAYDVSNFGSAFFDNSRSRYQKDSQAKAVLSRLREAGIQNSDLYTTDPNKRETIRRVLSTYLEDLKNF